MKAIIIGTNDRLGTVAAVLVFSACLSVHDAAAEAGIYAPAIVRHPTNMTARVGDSLTVFRVTATGGTPLTYIWLKGTNVVEVTPYWHYNIYGVQLSDAGDYSVMVSNAFGTTTSTVATLTVEPAGIPPFIPVYASIYGAPPGSTVHLSVTAMGTEPLSYQWFRTNALPGETNSTLTIYDLKQEDLGKYTLTAWNAYGSATVTAEVVFYFYQPVGTNVIRIKPTITFPSRGVTRVATNRITFEGRLDERTFYRGVFVQQNTNAFVQANPSYGPEISGAIFPEWSSEILLIPGTNVLRVKAIDTAGNSTLTNSRVVIFDVTSPLTLTTEGMGRVSGAANDDLLVVGREYILKARPSSGFVFSQWIGSVTSSASVLAFTMRSNAVLTASFVPNPFLGVAGHYHGLFSATDSNVVEHRSSGSITATVRPGGRFSASVRNGKRKHGFTGRFDLEGHSTNVVQRSGANALTVELLLDLQGSGITGRVTDGTWSSHIKAYRAVFNARNPATAFATNYTFLIPGAEEGSLAPAGDGFGTLKIDAAGMATLVGTLADGSRLAHKAPLSAAGDLAFYMPVNNGSLGGWLRVRPTGNIDLDGQTWWLRPASPDPKYYASGFTLFSTVAGSVFPSLGTNRLFDFDTMRAVFSDGNLDAAFTNTLALDPAWRFANTSPNSLNMAVTKAGLFRGIVTPPGSTHALSFKGAVLPHLDIGGGHFFGTNRIGRVSLGP